MPITRRRKQALEYIASFTRLNNYSPTLDELTVGLGLKSISGVHKIVQSLIDEGYLLNKDAGVARSLRITNKYTQELGTCPMCNRKIEE
jgi:SOS-response transcriptional repressor LexA